MLGALLQALADTLRTWPTIEPPKKAPRMADFYVFGLAVEEALEWPVGTFDRAYRENIERRNETAIESEPVAAEIMKHIEGEFIGTPTELLEYLNERVDETVQKGKRWPRAANALTGKLRRVASNLRAAGWTVEPDRHDPVGNRQVYLSHPSLRSDDSDDLFGNEMKEEGNKREEEGEAEGEHTYKWRKKPSKPSNRQSDRDAAEFEADNPFMNKGSEE
jgi:hypothetical protein